MVYWRTGVNEAQTVMVCWRFGERGTDWVVVFPRIVVKRGTDWVVSGLSQDSGKKRQRLGSGLPVGETVKNRQANVLLEDCIKRHRPQDCGKRCTDWAKVYKKNVALVKTSMNWIMVY